VSSKGAPHVEQDIAETLSKSSVTNVLSLKQNTPRLTSLSVLLEKLKMNFE